MGRYDISWKTIDTLYAKVPGSDGIHNEVQPFNVRFGRYVAHGRGRRPGGIDLDDGKDEEVFRIESIPLGIQIDAPTLQECKAQLRKKLEASEDYTGTWSLWVKVDAEGGFQDDAGSYSYEQHARAVIDTKFYVHLDTVKGSEKRTRHIALREPLPKDWDGVTFWVPKTHAELADLRSGPAFQEYKRSYRRRNDMGDGEDDLEETDDVYVPATLETVLTLRALQEKLGDMGAKVQQALDKKRLLKSLAAVREGSLPMLGAGPSG